MDLWWILFYVCSDISYFFLTIKYYKMLLFDVLVSCRKEFRNNHNFALSCLRKNISFFMNECEGNWNLEINIVQSNKNIVLKVCLHQKLYFSIMDIQIWILICFLNILIKCSLNKLTCWEFFDMGFENIYCWLVLIYCNIWRFV